MVVGDSFVRPDDIRDGLGATIRGVGGGGGWGVGVGVGGRGGGGEVWVAGLAGVAGARMETIGEVVREEAGKVRRGGGPDAMTGLVEAM